MTTPSPALPTFSDGQVTTAAQLNAIASNANNLYSYLQGGKRIRRPMCAVRVVKENRELPTNVDVRIGWDQVDIDTDNMWSGVESEPIRIHTAGWYRVALQASLQPATAAANTVLAARIAFWNTGTHSPSSQSIAVGYGPALTGLGSVTSCSTVAYLPADYQFDFYVTHNMGVTAALDNAFGGTRGYALWLGPG